MTKKLHPLAYSALRVSDAAFLNSKAKELWPTGSLYLCNPRPSNTDEDILVLVDEYDLSSFESMGFCRHHEDTYDPLYPTFESLRKGRINLVVTSDSEFFLKFKNATEEAKEKNILDKEKRIEFFSNKLYEEEILF